MYVLVIVDCPDFINNQYRLKYVADSLILLSMELMIDSISRNRVFFQTVIVSGDVEEFDTSNTHTLLLNVIYSHTLAHIHQSEN